MEKTLKKRMRIMLIAVGILFGLIFAYKLFVSIMIKRFMAAHANPIVTVSTMKVGYDVWQPQINGSGSSRAIRGVNVTTQLAGMVDKISFTPGASVKEGAVLVQLNADTEIAQLHSLEANADLAKITYERDKAQYAVHAISKAQLDTDVANLKSNLAQVEEQKTTIAKKTIRAPFSGKLGISLVNPGQYLNPGDPVVNLQTLDPMWIDFYLPQQNLAELRLGQTVYVTSDTYPGKKFTGKITTINPGVDVNSRNVQVEATVANPDFLIAPGMFVYVEVDVGKPRKYLTVPQTAVTFNPYGQLIYIIREEDVDKDGQKELIARQAFVVTGDTRGDQVAVIKGLKEGETIVTSGQLKLKNGSRVTINNKIVPSNEAEPKVAPDY